MTPQRRYEYKQYRVFREHLLTLMNKQCLYCGTRKAERWIFHHPDEKDWQSRKVNSLQRIRRYMRDYNEGNLQLVCHACHNGTQKRKRAS